ncbi:MAG: CopG family transcriptional regulator [Proteobacteria bacterium]|nr:CopG family transcriptional regulator [Pseudomonadota bacterium]MBI3499634.1 CopG family transcriptional regulator [Pseudomonadota bacterium]
MKALVDIGESEIRALDELARKAKRSRAALIRQAIAEYLGKHRHAQERDAFGLWGNHRVDGLAYQERMRGEW